MLISRTRDIDVGLKEFPSKGEILDFLGTSLEDNYPAHWPEEAYTWAVGCATGQAKRVPRVAFATHFPTH